MGVRGLNAAGASTPRPAVDQVRDGAVVEGELKVIMRGAEAAENANGFDFLKRRTGG